MRVLITNDDGVNAEGIKVLADEISKIADVTVIAPDRERSAVGHGVTFFSPMRLFKLSEEEHKIIYKCSGTPVDCIIMGLNHVMKDTPPDLVITGINRGINIGDDFHCSGTISSAVEGALSCIQSIAVSCATDIEFNVPSYEPIAKIASCIAEKIFKNPLPKRVMLNLNAPVGKIKDIKLTHLGFSNFKYDIISRKDALNLDYFWFNRKSNYQNEKYEGSDYQAVMEGYASLTPINLDFPTAQIDLHEIIDKEKIRQLTI